MNYMKDVTNINRELWTKISLYGILFFAALFVVVSLFSNILANATDAILGVTAQFVQPGSEEFIAQAASVQGTLLYVISVIIIFVVLLIYLYSFTENLIWNTIFKKKTTFKNTNKFLLLNILLTIIFVLIAIVVFLLIANFGLVGAIIFYLVAFFSIYLMYVGFISFGKTHKILKSVRNAFVVGIKKLKITLVPLLISVVIGLAVNAILIVITPLVPEAVFIALDAVAISIYMGWFRIYLSNVLKSVKF